jgi:hypothetical protein
MQFQATLVESFLYGCLDPYGLLFAFAVHQNVIGVTFKRYVIVVAPHPFIKRY